MKIIIKIISLLGLLIYSNDWEKLKKITRKHYKKYNSNNKLPYLLIETLIIAEDKRFYTHNGIDPKAIFRALWRTIFQNRLEGGSTITQQLVRTLLNEKEITITRKIKEICLATLFEKIIPKEDIPGLYLYEAYFGWRMNGIKDACIRTGYDINDLTCVEAASLIARLKYPEPRLPSKKRMEKIKNRKDYLIKQILNLKKGDIELEPFEVSDNCSSLKGQYLDPILMYRTLLNVSTEEKKSVLRLWITEGIPHAFRKYPMIYEEIRKWLAERLDIHEKEITLIGSARTGYSLSSYPKYGDVYNHNSDLDFSIISSNLFDRLTNDFNKWLLDYRNGRVNPRNKIEKSYWERNEKEVPNNIKKGFIDSNKVPYWNMYPTAQNMGQTIYLLREKIKLSGLETEKVTIRIYNNWTSFINQQLRNLEYLISSFDIEKEKLDKHLKEISATFEETN